MTGHFARFDEQAELFDRRAGLRPDVGASIAHSISETAELTDSDALLEIGAGTGEVGQHLAVRSGGYVGLDLSRPMLEIFRRKLGTTAHRAVILQADCDLTWPVQNRSVTAIFASRVAHQLDAERVAEEIVRTCRPKGYVLLGRVHRDPESVRSRLRRQRQALLAQRGIAARRGNEGTRKLIEACHMHGAKLLAERVAANWSATTTARRVLADWEPLSTMGGVELGPDVRASVLADLRDWARAELGDLDAEDRYGERYLLQVLRLQ